MEVRFPYIAKDFQDVASFPPGNREPSPSVLAHWFGSSLAGVVPETCSLNTASAGRARCGELTRETD